jgi:hypothetical protein
VSNIKDLCAKRLVRRHVERPRPQRVRIKSRLETAVWNWNTKHHHQLTTTTNMARIRSELAFLVSFLLTLSVILNAFYHKKQFYPSVVYLTKSNSSMAVIYLQAFVVALLIGKLMNKIFFGQLRAIEMEVRCGLLACGFSL